MNKFVKMMALVLVMVLSVGMLTACGETEPTTKPTTAPTTAPTAPAPEKDVVGVIKEISSTFVVLET